MTSRYQYLHRKFIDDTLWNSLVSEYHDGFPYQYTWYLDALTDGNWYGMVFGNYRAIFPLAVNRKWFGMKQAYQPFLSQRFDLVGEIEVEDYVVLTSRLAKTFKKLNFNTSTAIGQDHFKVTNRVNQVIDLAQPISVIRKHYNKSTRRLVRLGNENLTISIDSDIESYLQFYKAGKYPKQKPILAQWDMFKRLLEFIKSNQMLEIISILYDGRIVASSAYVITSTRVINLIGASDPLCREHYGNYIKIDTMLAKYAEEKEVFDFFGSNLDGVAKFNSNFGAVAETYYGISK